MGKTMSSIDYLSDLLKEIFLRLPLKSLVKFKTVSKEWISILESKSFIDMHLNFQKSGKSRRRKILAAYKCNCCDRPNLSLVSGMEGDEEIVYLHCDPARPSMSCDGLVCIPEPDWVNVLNPSTGQHRRFPSGPVPEPSWFVNRYKHGIRPERWLANFPGNWAMGFGKDRVTGRYKVLRMLFDPMECDILDVEDGEWRKLRPPPYKVNAGRRSASVNGTIYWLEMGFGYKILALDLHTQEFHDVTCLPLPYAVTDETQILNLSDRLAMSTTRKTEMKLEIWCMDSKEDRWTMTYSISLAEVAKTLHPLKVWWFTPVNVSKEGNVLICDDNKTLFKYYPHTNTTRCLSHSTCWVISPYLESFVRLRQN